MTPHPAQPNPASPPDRGIDTASRAVEAVKALHSENAALRAENAALRAERTSNGVLAQPVERLAYTIAEAAHALGTSRDRVEQLINIGALDSVAVGNRKIVPVSSLSHWLERNGSAPTALHAMRRGAAR